MEVDKETTQTTKTRRQQNKVGQERMTKSNNAINYNLSLWYIPNLLH
jgi:hypothetical protein